MVGHAARGATSEAHLESSMHTNEVATREAIDRTLAQVNSIHEPTIRILTTRQHQAAMGGARARCNATSGCAKHRGWRSSNSSQL